MVNTFISTDEKTGDDLAKRNFDMLEKFIIGAKTTGNSSRLRSGATQLQRLLHRYPDYSDNAPDHIMRIKDLLGDTSDTETYIFETNFQGVPLHVGQTITLGNERYVLVWIIQRLGKEFFILRDQKFRQFEFLKSDFQTISQESVQGFLKEHMHNDAQEDSTARYLFDRIAEDRKRLSGSVTADIEKFILAEIRAMQAHADLLALTTLSPVE